MFGHQDPEVTLVSRAQTKSCSITTTYPDVEVQIPICDRLDIKSDGGNGSDNLADLETRVVSIGAANAPETRYCAQDWYHTLSLYRRVVFPALSWVE